MVIASGQADEIRAIARTGRMPNKATGGPAQVSERKGVTNVQMDSPGHERSQSEGPYPSGARGLDLAPVALRGADRARVRPGGGRAGGRCLRTRPDGGRGAVASCPRGIAARPPGAVV